MPGSLTNRARGLRKTQTEDERKLWAQLRDRRLNGLKFRRQAPCGPYVVDFLCEAAQLIIELDGSHHDMPDQIERDTVRTDRLKELGYQVVRFRNVDLKSNLDRVLDEIVALARLRLSPSSAPPGHLLPVGEGRVRQESRK